MLQAEGSRESLLDQLVTHFVIHSAVHSNWTGLWCILDSLLSPLKSYVDVIFTWSIGSAILLLLLLAPPPSSKSSPWPVKTIFPYVWTFCGHGATVLWFRAMWMFFTGLAHYFPIWHLNTDVTLIYGHILSFGLLAASHISGTICGLGCSRDTDSVQTFDADFFSQFFKDEIDKLAEKEGESMDKTTPEKAAVDKNQNKLPSNVNMRKKPALSSQTSQELRVKRRTSLEDVVKADHRKKEQKAKEKRH